MIAAWIRDDELALVLNEDVWLDVVVGEAHRGDGERLVSKELIALFGVAGEVT